MAYILWGSRWLCSVAVGRVCAVRGLASPGWQRPSCAGNQHGHTAILRIDGGTPNIWDRVLNKYIEKYSIYRYTYWAIIGPILGRQIRSTFSQHCLWLGVASELPLLKYWIQYLPTQTHPCWYKKSHNPGLRHTNFILPISFSDCA